MEKMGEQKREEGDSGEGSEKRRGAITLKVVLRTVDFFNSMEPGQTET